MTTNIISNRSEIQGVILKPVTPFPDERGSFTEVFRSEWAIRCNYGNEIQLNLSRSREGALRGLHFHRKQNDWWVPINGTVQVALADLRQSSQTCGRTMVFHLSWEDSVCLLIPPGVAHGFLAVTDVTLMYAVDRYYDGTDEQGVIWNDSALRIPWLMKYPTVSERDMNNPTMEELRQGELLPG